jgi:hypothetical protein
VEHDRKSADRQRRRLVVVVVVVVDSLSADASPGRGYR